MLHQQTFILNVYVRLHAVLFLRVSVSALCSVQLHTWTDAASNKVRLPLIWCPTQRLLLPSRQYSNSLLDQPLQSSATLCRETLNLGPRQALLNTHSTPLGTEVVAGWVHISHGSLHISPPQPCSTTPIPLRWQVDYWALVFLHSPAQLQVSVGNTAWDLLKLLLSRLFM